MLNVNVIDNPIMGSEEEEDSQTQALTKIDKQIASLKSQLDALLKQRASFLKTIKRPATDSIAENDHPKRKKTEQTTPSQEGLLVELQVGANEEVKSAVSENQVTQRDADKENWKTVQHKRVPPIFIYGLKNWSSLAMLLKELCKEPFTAKNGPDNLKLQVTNPDDYRAVSAYLENEGVEFHSYNTEKSNALKVVIKNIPPTVETQTIASELKSRGFEPTHVGQLKDKWGNPLAIYQVTLPKSDKAKQIYALDTLAYCKIKVETYRKKKQLTQCHRCQRFGHTANFCKAQAKCVKCALEHLTKDCTKTDKTSAKCINCGDKHPASYRGCKYYLELKQKMVSAKINQGNKKKEEIISDFVPRINNRTSASSNKKSYSEAIKNSTKPSDINQEIKAQLAAFIAAMQKLIN